MKEKAKKIFIHPLFSGSLIMIIGSNANNFLNYLYHFVMGRILGPADYGELVSLLSLVTVISIIPSSLIPTVVKFISSHRSDSQLTGLVSWFHQKSFLLSAASMILVVLLSPFLVRFLHISNIFFVLGIGVMLLFSLPFIVYRSVLQGLLKFKQLIVSILSESSLKLVGGVIFVLLGLKVAGALLAVIFAAFVGWSISKFYIKKYFSSHINNSVVYKDIIRYSVPVFIYSLATTSLFSSDLLLVKHFFSAHEAGIYASLSNLGKVIIFGSGPVASVMFPLVSKRKAEGQNYKNIFFYSILLTAAIAFGVSIFYIFLPHFSIELLYGSQYIEGTRFLGQFSLFATFLALSMVFINFHLSAGDTKVVILPFIAAIGQVAGILLFHQNLGDIIIVSLLSSALLLILLLLYFYLNYAKKAVFSYSSRLQTGEEYL